jgi:hypothetical protein
MTEKPRPSSVGHTLEPVNALKSVAAACILAVGLIVLSGAFAGDARVLSEVRGAVAHRSSVAQDTARAPGRSGTGPLRVLFIGNSYTYYNDLPSVIADLTRDARETRPIVAEQLTVGGATLESHVERGEAVRRIRAGSSRGAWDVVVLQEQSTRPLEDTAKMYRAVRALAAEARRVGARPALYVTWARLARPHAQDTLSRAYRRIAAELGALVVPVGDAWAMIRGTDEAIGRSLFIGDGSHPSPSGTYLAASTFYATLYGKSPVGLSSTSRRTNDQPMPGSPAGSPAVPLAKELAARLQMAAWRVVSGTPLVR